MAPSWSPPGPLWPAMAGETGEPPASTVTPSKEGDHGSGGGTRGLAGSGRVGVDPKFCCAQFPMLPEIPETISRTPPRVT